MEVTINLRRDDYESLKRYARGVGRSISECVKFAIREQIAEASPELQSADLDRIAQAVTKVWGILPQALSAPGRTQKLAAARHCFVWYAVEHTQHTKSEVSMYLNRHRTTSYNSFDLWDGFVQHDFKVAGGRQLKGKHEQVKHELGLF